MLEHEGRRYAIRFYYGVGHSRKPIKGVTDVAHRSVHTRAEVVELVPQEDGRNAAALVAVGECLKHKNDEFRKDVGRRTALGRATSSIADKRLRYAIWNRYADTHSDGCVIQRHQ
jgi:hypothetical protein